METLDKIRPVWAEIDLDNLVHNIKEVKNNVSKETLVTAVVKANGYGHGSINIARTFLDNGADRLAVAILNEAIELRLNGISEPIMVLGYTPYEQYEEVLKYDIIQTINTYEEGLYLSTLATTLNKVAKVHIKIDTGMGRLGFLPNETSINEIVKISKLSNIDIEGIFTHFATADDRDKSFTRLQYERFVQVVSGLENQGIKIPIKHVSNSAAIIDMPEYNLDMVRAGIMLYGYYPSEEVGREKIKLKPAMKLKAKISKIKILPQGAGISYGQIFTTFGESKIGTLPIGYADGYSRIISEKAYVMVKGKKAPVVGRICMDQCMIDITQINDVNIHDEVILFGYDSKAPTVEEIAGKLNTINYEVICMVGRRVPRVYLSKGKIVNVKDYLV